MAAQDLNVLPIFSKWRGFNSNFALFDKIFSTKRHIFSNNFPTTHFCLGGAATPSSCHNVRASVHQSAATHVYL